ncbi:Uncharacterized protein Fot_56406 [Forsythia ovata]|uniref:Uncharacterized protein n=1 Tax=Forsythia ovata TaxID=205694 RepID=A0ABD1P022_9LAMI
MVKSKGQFVNIELEIGINSKRSKRKTSTSGNRIKRSKNSVQEDFKELKNVQNTRSGEIVKGDCNSAGCCNLNQVVMDRIDKIESKQSEILAKEAEILSFQWDLKSQLNNICGNVQSMIADFLNHMDKKLYSNTEEDEFENNDFNNYNEFETDVQVEDNDGSQLKDFEVEVRNVQYNRKGKAVVCEKTNNESVHHGATEFEEDDDIIQIDDITPIALRKRTRKTVAVYRSPYISDFISSGKSKTVIREIKSGTFALSNEIDIVDFEEWFNMGKKKYNDSNKILNPPFSFGILEVPDKRWFYDLRTPEECLTDTIKFIPPNLKKKHCQLYNILGNLNMSKLQSAS